ncbi:MAG: rhomboid family intramembrane serine protease [Candidatus Altiarchaeales archaeon ex4484_2]|nr:MAG: rhomboid family intramembrane serine protease [Candidatus Altiarchaeales archaeon ex4484_2]
MRIFGMYLGAIESIITLNILVFVLTMIDESFFVLFTLVPKYVLVEPWTLITSMFTHVNFNHLLFNMIGLFFLGSYLERLIGESRFLRVYFLGGLAGGVLAVLTAYAGFTDVFRGVVGASGAIFAIAACLAILRPNLRIFLFPIPFPMPLYIAVFGFMLMMSFQEGISWAGHLGGLIIGVIYGNMFKNTGIGGTTKKHGQRFY